MTVMDVGRRMTVTSGKMTLVSRMSKVNAKLGEIYDIDAVSTGPISQPLALLTHLLAP